MTQYFSLFKAAVRLDSCKYVELFKINHFYCENKHRQISIIKLVKQRLAFDFTFHSILEFTCQKGPPLFR